MSFAEAAGWGLALIGLAAVWYRRRYSERASPMGLLAGAATFAALLILGTASSFGLAWNATVTLLAKGTLCATLARMAMCDWHTLRIPRELSWAMFGTGLSLAAARLFVDTDTRALPFWIGLDLVWQMRWLGGGDAKVLMGAFGVWPEPVLLGLVAGAMFARGVVFYAWRESRRYFKCLAPKGSLASPRSRPAGRRGVFAKESRVLERDGTELTRGLTLPKAEPTSAATWAYALAISIYMIGWA